MLKPSIFLWLACAACNTAPAQQRLLLGTIESNFINWEQDKNNPYFAAVHFEKSNGQWRVADSNLPPALNFSVFYKAKRIKSLPGVADNEMERMGGMQNCYRISAKAVPVTGKKNMRFAGWAGQPVYQPLVISNRNQCKSSAAPQQVTPATTHRQAVERFLQEMADRDSLGPLPLPPAAAIDSICTVLAINDSCFLLEAHMRLNMYHYTEKVPFSNTGSENWFRYEQLVAAENECTPYSWFLIKGGTVQFAGVKLLLMDYADYDRDGSPEILLKMSQHYNQDGYVLITDRLSTVLTRTWGYH